MHLRWRGSSGSSRSEGVDEIRFKKILIGANSQASAIPENTHTQILETVSTEFAYYQTMDA